MLFVLILPRVSFASVETAKSICVMNTITGEIVFAKDEDTKKPMASTTKIITLIAALENSAPDDIVTVSREATLQEGSSAYLKPNAKITMRDLCYGLMLNSGNDAAVAVAEHISGDTERFARLMNATAKKIGVTSSNFVNPNGLHNDEHYTTARDLAKITRYALDNEMFREIVSSKMYTSHMTMPDGEVVEVEYINHNRLLRDVEGCIGVKTGFTKNAGRCLVSAIDKDGAEYVIVTLNDSDDWRTHKELYKKTIDSANLKTIVKSGDCIEHIEYNNSKCSLVTKNDFSVFTNNEGNNEFEIVKHIPTAVDFSLNKGEKVGYIEIKSNGAAIGQVDVVAERDFMIENRAELRDCFMFTVMNLLRSIV